MKELEQRLQLLLTHKEKRKKKKTTTTETDKNKEIDADDTAAVMAAPFSELYTLPQHSTTTSSGSLVAEGAAEVEVRMVERHASIKIRTRRRRKQLLRMVSGFHTLRLTILHLNATTFHHSTVLYSISAKVITFTTHPHYSLCFFF